MGARKKSEETEYGTETTETGLPMEPQETGEGEINIEPGDLNAMKKALVAAEKEITRLKNAEIARIKEAAAREIAEAKGEAEKGIGEARKAEKPAAVERVQAKDPALEMVSVTVPMDRGNRVPYTTSIIVPGFGAKHYVIPRGVPVKVPRFVAKAIMEDVKQQFKMDALIEKEERKFNDMMKTAFGVK